MSIAAQWAAAGQLGLWSRALLRRLTPPSMGWNGMFRLLAVWSQPYLQVVALQGSRGGIPVPLHRGGMNDKRGVVDCFGSWYCIGGGYHPAPAGRGWTIENQEAKKEIILKIQISW